MVGVGLGTGDIVGDAFGVGSGDMVGTGIGWVPDGLGIEGGAWNAVNATAADDTSRVRRMIVSPPRGEARLGRVGFRQAVQPHWAR